MGVCDCIEERDDDKLTADADGEAAIWLKQKVRQWVRERAQGFEERAEEEITKFWVQVGSTIPNEV